MRSSTRSRKLKAARAAIEIARRKSIEDRHYFMRVVFPKSFEPGEYRGGKYVDGVTDLYEEFDELMRVTARGHMKSVGNYADVMYDIFTMERNIEGHYFSYNSDFAAYHVEKIKRMIRSNIYYSGIRDNKSSADSVMDYEYKGKRYTMKPNGLMSFKRGIHGDRIYVDDPLRDPENKLAPTVIKKINRVMATEVPPMVNIGGKLRVVGTPQTNQDFFFSKDLAEVYKIVITDAIVDEKRKIVLWPEMYNWDYLMRKKREQGEKAFNQEYRAKPAYEEDSRVSRDSLIKVIDEELEPADAYEGELDVVGFHDIGKKRHPAHCAIFTRELVTSTYEDEDGNAQEVEEYYYVQLVSKWFDGVDYGDQIDWLNEAVEVYNVDVLGYDNTRGEFEAFAEENKLADEMKPINFTLKTKNKMATALDSAVTAGRVKLLNDPRQTEQILAVNTNLDAMESPDGHGDSFWSVGGALSPLLKTRRVSVWA